MHILEMHIIEWMSTYNAGLGLMGEQGTEAIHAHFKQVVYDVWLYHLYGKVQWLKCIMQEPYNSTLNALKPIRKIKRKRED